MTSDAFRDYTGDDARVVAKGNAEHRDMIERALAADNVKEYVPGKDRRWHVRPERIKELKKCQPQAQN